MYDVHEWEITLCSQKLYMNMSEYDHAYTYGVNNVSRGNSASAITINRPKRYVGAVPKYDSDTYSISTLSLSLLFVIFESDRNI